MKAKLPSSAKKGGIIISGAHGMGNIGDEAALAGIISDLKSIAPSAPICVLSRDPKCTALKHGVESVHSFNLPALWRRLKNCALFISGGGSLIQDVSSTRSLLYYLLCLRLAKLRGCPVMMYGCGIGPVSKNRNRRIAAKIIDRCVDTITLRDNVSFEELKALGVSSPKIFRAADPALSIDDMKPEERLALMKSCDLDPEETYICFCLRPWEGFSKMAELFALAADHAFRCYGLKSVFLSMSPKEDENAAQQVISRCNCPAVLIRRPYDARETAGLISGMKMLLGMRLHALVFAARSAVPTVGISYDPKVAAFLKYIGRDNFVHIKDLTKESLLAMIDAAAASLPGTNETPEVVMEELKNISRDAVAELLKKEKTV